MPYDIIYMWNLQYDTNEPIYETNKIMDVENRLVVVKGEEAGQGMEWEVQPLDPLLQWGSKMVTYIVFTVL